MSGSLVVLTLSSVLLAQAASAPAASAPPVLAQVEGVPITADDVTLFLSLRGATDPTPALRDAALDEMIERALIRRFLTERQTVADPEQTAAAASAAKARLAAAGHDPDALLKSLKIDDARLRAEVALPLAWQTHVRRVVTDAQIRKHYDTHRRRLDGTRLRVSQIFLPYAAEESAAAAPQTGAQLEAIRSKIVAGTLTFAAAARQHSAAPTAAAGGDVGWISPRGDLPHAVADAAYRTDSGGVSNVVFSPFGGHLVQVTDTQPGDSSLEDVRPQVLAELSAALWDQTVAQQRETATISRNP